MSDTPRTDAAYFAKGATLYDLAGAMKKIERELAAANERIKSLERAIQRLVESPDDRSLEDITPEELESWENAKAVLENKE